jgi:hypothetical protein
MADDEIPDQRTEEPERRKRDKEDENRHADVADEMSQSGRAGKKRKSDTSRLMFAVTITDSV